MLTQKRPPRCQLLTAEGVTSNAEGEDQPDDMLVELADRINVVECSLLY